jgi:hypothetical protein
LAFGEERQEGMESTAPKTWPYPWPKERSAALLCPGLNIGDTLRDRLREVREQQMAEHLAGRPLAMCGIFYEREVVCLKAGCGHAAFLGLDGRVWAENYGQGLESEVFTDARDIASVIVRWAGNIGLPELVELLPTKPADAFVCGVCGGSRWLPTTIGVHDDGRPLCCLRCYGLGWTFAEQIAAADRPRE